MGDGAVAVGVQSVPSRNVAPKPKRAFRKNKNTEIVDPDILWLVFHSAGEMGFRAAPIEPGTKASHAHTPAHLLQMPASVLAAAGRQRRVIAALWELSDDVRAVLLAAHSPLPPALHADANAVDPLDSAGCGLAGPAFWLCSRPIETLVAAYEASGASKDEGWRPKLEAARTRVQGAREGRLGPKAGYLEEMALILRIARKMVLTGLEQFRMSFLALQAEDWARMGRRREAREERFRDLVCAEEITRRVTLRSVGVP